MLFSTRRSAAGAWCDSYDDHVNPHVLLFAAFCAFKLIPGKQMLVFLMGHRHLFFLI